MARTFGRRYRRTTALVACLVLAGCAETTRITTNPPGAKVTINGRLVGISPVYYTVRRSEWPQNNRFLYVMELNGFETKEGEFQGHVSPGRIIGSIFTTAGLSLAWESPLRLPNVEVDLVPLGTAQPGAPGKPPIAERLQRVNDLYEQGLITEQERRRLRSEILNEQP